MAGQLLADLGFLLLAALAGGLAAHLLRQPPVVGYVVAGVLVGGLTGTGAEPAPFELFAQIGVVLLLFSAGVEFSLSDLWRAWRLALYGTPAGMAAIVLVVSAFGVAAGWDVRQAIAAGAALSVTSTAVLFKFLQDRHEMGSAHGRILVGVSLAQDLLAVILMALLPVLAPEAGSRPAQAGLAVFRAVAVLVPLLWLGRRLIPVLLARVARTRNMELFLVTVVVLALGTAAFASGLGLSPALGAFLAGLVVSESEFAHEILARVLPLRDVFVALFFLSVGMVLDLETLRGQLPTVLGLAGLVVVGNTLVWTGVVRAAGYPWRVAALCGLGLGQMGEFSYLIAATARQAGVLEDSLYQAVLGASLVTILANAALFRGRPAWLERWLGQERVEVAAAGRGGVREPAGHAVLCGFGRVGQEVAQALEAFGIPYAVVDLDPGSLQAARRRAATAVFGDVGSPRALRRAGVESARLVVVAVPDPGAASRCVREVRNLAPQVPVLARVHHATSRALLLEAGATEVVQPEVEAALTMVRHSLDWLGVSHEAGRAYLKRARAHWPELVRSEGFVEGLQAREVVVRNPQLVGRSLRQARLYERTGAVVATVTHPDGREVVNPPLEEVLRRGDRLVAMGEPEQLEALERLCEAPEEDRV